MFGDTATVTERMVSARNIADVTSQVSILYGWISDCVAGPPKQLVM